MCKGTLDRMNPYEKVSVLSNNVPACILFFFLFSVLVIVPVSLSFFSLPFFIGTDLDGISPELLPGAFQTILPGRVGFSSNLYDCDCQVFDQWYIITIGFNLKHKYQ